MFKCVDAIEEVAQVVTCSANTDIDMKCQGEMMHSQPLTCGFVCLASLSFGQCSPARWSPHGLNCSAHHICTRSIEMFDLIFNAFGVNSSAANVIVANLHHHLAATQATAMCVQPICQQLRRGVH